MWGSTPIPFQGEHDEKDDLDLWSWPRYPPTRRSRVSSADGFFAVALAARSADKLDAAVKALGAKATITAAAFFRPDLGNPQAVKQLVSSVHAKLGPLNVLHWNVYAFGAGDIAADPAELQEFAQCLHDGPVDRGAKWVRRTATSKMQGRGAGHRRQPGCFYDPKVDAMAVEIWRSRPGGQQGSAAQADGPSQSVRLGKEGIYVGEVVVTGAVKGTVSDQGNASIEADALSPASSGRFTRRVASDSTTIWKVLLERVEEKRTRFSANEAGAHKTKLS